jgi:hypothetical protein
MPRRLLDLAPDSQLTDLRLFSFKFANHKGSQGQEVIDAAKMRFSLAFFAGLAVASPLGNILPRVDGVRIISMNAIGTGCPAGHAVVQLDATGSVFDVAMDQYTVEVGPGTALSDARKNCRITINLEFPSGYQ